MYGTRLCSCCYRTHKHFNAKTTTMVSIRALSQQLVDSAPALLVPAGAAIVLSDASMPQHISPENASALRAAEKTFASLPKTACSVANKQR